MECAVNQATGFGYLAGVGLHMSSDLFKYHISSFNRCSVYKLPKGLDAALIEGRHLYHFLTLFMWRLLESGVK